MTIIESLSEFVSNLEFAEIPIDVRRKTKSLILHHLHTGYSGINETDSQIALKLVNQYHRAEGNATILGQPKKTSAISAAFANAVLMHSIQQEDTYKGLHPGPHTIPAGFALGEEESIEGKTILSAIIAGYEVNIKIGDLCMSYSGSRGWRGTTIYGVLGAAATSAHALGLNQKETVYTLANSVNMASGLMQCWLEGTSEWLFASGLAAQNGVISALLARSGSDGARFSFEGDRGFFHAYCGQQPDNINQFMDSLGSRYSVPDVSLKAYSVITTILPVIHNIIFLAKENEIPFKEIVSVEILAGNRVTKGPLSSSILDFGPYLNKTQAYKSLPCATAIGLVFGDVSVETVNHYQDNEVKELAKIVDVKTEESYEGFYNKVVITTIDGRKHQIEGDEFPSLTDKEVEANFRRSASKHMSAGKVEELIKNITNIEKIKLDRLF